MRDSVTWSRCLTWLASLAAFGASMAIRPTIMSNNDGDDDDGDDDYDDDCDDDGDDDGDDDEDDEDDDHETSTH